MSLRICRFLIVFPLFYLEELIIYLPYGLGIWQGKLSSHFNKAELFAKALLSLVANNAVKRVSQHLSFVLHLDFAI
jgi:hypothetical protein